MEKLVGTSVGFLLHKGWSEWRLHWESKDIFNLGRKLVAVGGARAAFKCHWQWECMGARSTQG